MNEKKWLASTFELSNGVGLYTLFVMVAILVLLYITTFSPNCPHSPDAPVAVDMESDLFWANHWLDDQADSIETLNAALESFDAPHVGDNPIRRNDSVVWVGGGLTRDTTAASNYFIIEDHYHRVGMVKMTSPPCYGPYPGTEQRLKEGSK